MLGLGTFDGPALLATLVRLVEEHAHEIEDRGTFLRETPALGPGIHTLGWEGEERLLLAARRDMVFACATTRASEAMLRKVLATGGRSAVVPPDERVCTMVGRGHVLDHLFEMLGFAREVGLMFGREGAELPKVLEDFLASHGGLASWRLVVDGDGSRLRVKL